MLLAFEFDLAVAYIGSMEEGEDEGRSKKKKSTGMTQLKLAKAMADASRRR